VAQRRRVVVAAAASAPAPALPNEEEPARKTSTLVLGAMFALWYVLNIFFNIFNKEVLRATATPFTNTALQFAIGALFCGAMWTCRLHKAPKFDPKQLWMIMPLAVVHTLGNLLTNVSLGKVAVSFTHTIKAMEPFFSVALSSIFLGTPVTAPVLLALLPIVVGVALASISEVSFNWIGFGAAMGSNLTFQSRNVLSKKLMAKDAKKGLDNINLFSIITILSLALMAPVAYVVEGTRFTPAGVAALGLDWSTIFTKACLAGLFFHGYQQVSYMILERVAPVTHSVGNCVKRVAVIVSSVIVFQNPVSPLNAVGTCIALLGVFAYSRVKAAEAAKEA